MSARRRLLVGNDKVRSAKETLISRGLARSGDIHPAWLPGEIDRSWRRSISAGANRASDAFQFINEFDADSELRRAARPVLERLESTLQDMGTAILPTVRARSSPAG
jgi:hypothetical protein